MDQQKKNEIFDHAKAWILEAGERIKSKIDSPRSIETKSNPNDLVTEMDQETEQFFAQKINETYQDHYLLGEEGFGDEIEDLGGTVWIVDPIDGTMNFVHQKRNFAISIGIYYEGVGEIGLIYNVMEETLYTARRGEGAYKNEHKLPMLDEERPLSESILALNTSWMIPENPHVEHQGMQDLVKKLRSTRSYGSAALEFAFVAEGLLDGYLTMTLMPWDYAAGSILVREVGGIVTRADREELDLLNKTTVLASRPNIHEEISTGYVRLKK
ncbi:myo-inositol-1(or 4)-monophosphatase [Halobacillus karajensis]|uniref:inositol-phosphate phosphatase n=1 Tax=Halobacillus karajensis TaxID=195088 RepID=A0A024P2H5_9BACI|nr:inositol monophosphatase family protein [Halobacillus karajensis]CDQ19890.1 Inositol-1-monophosphatase [Halobacillus karajensis]CDQ22350.1 Inositol-1-monophosphatase [Halobacillus karajensis]CDQ28191.1 Inositol-1-monophosphatase [Halobacillus karajensis]SEH70424.1 myo-inositol-1(or 4)-monophosphatase [Halobacillus karajensis]